MKILIILYGIDYGQKNPKTHYFLPLQTILIYLYLS